MRGLLFAHFVLQNLSFSHQKIDFLTTKPTILVKIHLKSRLFHRKNRLKCTSLIIILSFAQFITVFWLAGSNKSGKVWWCPAHSKPTEIFVPEDKRLVAGKGPDYCVQLDASNGYLKTMENCEKKNRVMCSVRWRTG